MRINTSDRIPARRPRVLVVIAAAVWLLSLLEGAASAQRLNAESRWGTTFYYWNWYNTQGLPSYSIPPNLTPWGPQDQSWWNSVVDRAQYAGLSWIAANSWGNDTDADPVNLGPLVQAIVSRGNHMKVALFDDTTSEVLRKNRDKHGCWALPTHEHSQCPSLTDDQLRFDLSDSSGGGEGGWYYFYDLQWKRYFQTVPDAQRLKIDGRPVVILYHSGSGEMWYKNAASFDAMLTALKAATQAEFGFTPYVIVESTSSWAQSGMSMAHIDALYSWFGVANNTMTRTFVSSNTTPGGAMSVAMAIPGYYTPDQRAYRTGGNLYRGNLQWVVDRNPQLIMLESISNAEENAHLIETPEWGSNYINITRQFTVGAAAQPWEAPVSGVLHPNEQINPDQSLCSTTGRFCLRYQGDGNLVLYDNGNYIWTRGAPAATAGRAVMQGDGNFVVYNAAGGYVWDTKTYNHPGAYLVVHSDGDLLIYSATGTVLWERSGK